MNKPRTIKWRFPTKKSGEAIQRSVCDRYELIESRAKTGVLYTVVLNPEARGTYEFRVLFVERNRDAALDKLEDFEVGRRQALSQGLEKAA